MSTISPPGYRVEEVNKEVEEVNKKRQEKVCELLTGREGRLGAFPCLTALEGNIP